MNDLAWKGEPDIQAWLQDSRLNIGRAITGIETILQCFRDHRDRPITEKLAAEAAALEADGDDRAEMLAVAEAMESLRTGGDEVDPAPRHFTSKRRPPTDHVGVRSVADE